MKYYKVNPKFNDTQLYIRKEKNNYYEYECDLVPNELFTEKEFNNLMKKHWKLVFHSKEKPKNIKEVFQEVNYFKNKSYYFFGARFNLMQEETI